MGTSIATYAAWHLVFAETGTVYGRFGQPSADVASLVPWVHTSCVSGIMRIPHAGPDPMAGAFSIIRFA